jgi:hypothetical protein
MDNDTCEHKFEPRYDEIKTENLVGVHVLPSHTKIYVHDVCVKCGKIATRTSNFQVKTQYQ